MTDDMKAMSETVAREALGAARAAEAASRKRAQAPVWLNALMAVVVGIQFSVGIADRPELMIFCLAALFGLMAYQRKRSGVFSLDRPKGTLGWIGLAAAILVGLGVYVGGIYLTDNLGYTWGPLATGATIALLVFGATLISQR